MHQTLERLAFREENRPAPEIGAFDVQILLATFGDPAERFCIFVMASRTLEGLLSEESFGGERERMAG